MILVHHLDGDTTEPVVAQIVNDAEAAHALTIQPGKGTDNKPHRFYAFAGSSGQEVSSANFTGAPAVSNDESANQTAIDAMLANPPTNKVQFVAR